MGLRNASKAANDSEVGVSATPSFGLASLKCHPKNNSFVIGGLRRANRSSEFAIINLTTKSSTYSCQKGSRSWFSLRDTEGFASIWKVAVASEE